MLVPFFHIPTSLQFFSFLFKMVIRKAPLYRKREHIQRPGKQFQAQVWEQKPFTLYFLTIFCHTMLHVVHV